jgi:hypothetical protein
MLVQLVSLLMLIPAAQASIPSTDDVLAMDVRASDVSAPRYEVHIDGQSYDVGDRVMVDSEVLTYDLRTVALDAETGIQAAGMAIYPAATCVVDWEGTPVTYIESLGDALLWDAFGSYSGGRDGWVTREISWLEKTGGGELTIESWRAVAVEACRAICDSFPEHGCTGEQPALLMDAWATNGRGMRSVSGLTGVELSQDLVVELR